MASIALSIAMWNLLPPAALFLAASGADSVDEIDSRKVYDAAVQGDQVAKEIFDYTGKILGLALANFVMFSCSGSSHFVWRTDQSRRPHSKPTREHMEANLIQVFQNRVKILVSHLRESDAAILGASALVWEMA